MADPAYTMPIFSKTLIEINSFDLTRIPAGIIFQMLQGRSSDSSRLSRLPSVFTSGKECDKPKLPQRE